jgi:hypothetical protein
MSSVHPTTRRLGALSAAGFVLGALVILNTAVAPVDAAPAAQAACPAGAPVLSLANPNPGDVLSAGDIIVSGQAFDPAANAGSGIARVDLFLGSRDNGGLFLGSTAPAEGPSGQLFQLKATLPSSANGGRDFVAYAYSAVNGQQTSVSVPVFVGAAPPPPPPGSSLTPVALSETIESTCRGASVAAPAAPAVVGAPAVQHVPLASSAAPFLQLANPSAGDLLPSGDLFIDGVAYDLSSTSGAGIDRVELFLDSRDNGGLLIGSGVPASDRSFHIKAKIAGISNGGHNFVVYARSSLTGQESVASVPVFIGVAPTPTPRPSST